MSRATVRLTPLRRHLAAIITIAMSCGFVAVMVLAGGLIEASLRAQAAQRFEGADLVVTQELSGADLGSEQPLPAPAVDGTTEVWPLVEDFTMLRSTDHEAFTSLALSPPGTVPQLEQGRTATRAQEVVLDRALADALHVGVDDQISIPSQFSVTGEPLELTVTGIAALPPGAAFGGGGRMLLSEVNAATVLGPTAGTTSGTWLATVADGTDPAQVAQQAPAGIEVRTAQEVITEQADQFMQGMAPLAAILAVFVLIALFTAAVVIANTFAITIAQRIRSLALLRTVGATRAQVRSVVLREAALVGLLGAALGTLGGHLLVQALLIGAAALGWLEAVALVPISVLSIVLPLLAGFVITLLASLVPVRAATRVAPLQALRAEPPARRRGPRLREVAGGIALLTGLAALGAGAAATTGGQAGLGLLVSVLGGAVSFAGILLVLIPLTRPLCALFAALLGRIGGLPARIAGANVARTPGRSAATIAALLIGTTLMTMMAVGARTAETTLTAELDSRRPIDIVITAQQMPEGAAAQISQIRGIDTVVDAARTDAEVGAEEPMTLYAVSGADLAAVSHRPGVADTLADGVVVMGLERAQRFGLEDGQRIEVPGADGRAVPLTVSIDANLQMSFVTPQTLAQITGDGAQPVLLADLADPGSAARQDRDAAAVVLDVQQKLEQDGFSEASVTAGVIERETMGQILRILLGITVALLAVAVLVALVGVANTLSLGVVERTGENALLRALGTTRGQMRAMLTWEGVLLSLVGALLGVLLGAVYGVLGIIAVMGSAYPVAITIPWPQLGLVLALALAAGALASVLPARTAARTAPAAALAAQE